MKKLLRWLLRVFFYLLSVGFGVFLVICSFIYLNQEKVIFFAERLPDHYEFKFANATERDYYPAPGARLNALLFRSSPQNRKRGLIFYLHGNTGSLRTWGGIVKPLTYYGYDVLVFDYRVFGKSKGNIDESILLSDAEYVYQQMIKEYPENKIVVYGRSLGSGLAAYVASRNNPSMLILETPYFSLLDLSKNLGDRYNIPWFPYEWILKYHLRTDLYLPKVKCPVYLFHGQLDELIYYQSSQKLMRFFKKGDILFSIPDGKHADLSLHNEFTKNLKKVLKGQISRK